MNKIVFQEEQSSDSIFILNMTVFDLRNVIISLSCDFLWPAILAT